VLGRGTREFLGALLVVALLSACDYETSSSTRAESDTSKVRNRPGDAPAAGGQRQARDGKQRRDRRDDTQRGPARMALAALAMLPVKGRAPMTGYMREAFGQGWLDADRNGCDTRNDMLGRDLIAKTYDPKTRGCVVLSGTLVDPYTATRIEYVRGDGTLVDVDHVVALGNAWATGAYRWQIGKAAAFANDPMNLLPVEASANRQKGDGDAATWLPPNKAYRCTYVARQVAMKAKYGLWVTEPERAAVARVLQGCPGQRLPADSGAPIPAPVNLPDPRAPQAGTSPGSGDEVYFENCDAARAAGATPVRRGDPGYGSHLDGDADGLACE